MKKISLKKGLLYPLLMLAAFEVFYIPAYFLIRTFVSDDDWTQSICDLAIRLPVALMLARRLAREDGAAERPMKPARTAILAVAWVACICLPVQFFTHIGGPAAYEPMIPAEAVRFVIAAPLMEEAFYRGVLFRQTRRGFGYKTALIIHAITFNFMHMNPYYIIVTLPLAMTACALAETTGRLRYGMLLHFLFNLLGYALANISVGDDLGVWTYLILVPAFLIVSTKAFFPRKQKDGAKDRSMSRTSMMI